MAYLSDPKADVYADLQQDAKAFYGQVATKYHKPALAVLRELDPPDPQTDEAAIQHYMAQVTGETKYPVSGNVRAQAVRQWAEGRVTLQRYIAKAAGSEPLIKVKDFYRDAGVISLFPAYVEARIQQGLLQTSLVNELIFADEQSDSTEVVAVYASDTAAERELRQVGQGAELPVTDLAVADSTITLNKYGRQLRWSYESASNRNVDAIGNMLTKIGRQVGVDETDRLLHIAIAGDGTTAGAAASDSTDTDVASSGTIAFSDMLTWYYSVGSSAYQLNKAVGGKTDMAKIADLVEFSDVEYIAGQANLRIPTPVAMNYYWWDGSVTGSSYLDRMVVGFDTRVAMMAYSYGGFISESDKMIDRQLNRQTFAYWRGFRKFDATGVKVLDCATVL